MRITVVIPLYNKHFTIQRSLQSVFNQAVPPEEIIVVNDGSTDGSEKLVEALNHPLIKLIHQTNAGVSAARNSGIKEAKGDWIAFLDADDEWEYRFLETIESISLRYPKCCVLATAYIIKDQNGTQKKMILNKIPFSGDHGILKNYFEVASCSHPPLWTSALVVKKNAITSIGGFPFGVKSGEDLLTWARLAVKYEIGYTIIPHSIYNLDPSYTYVDKPKNIPEVPDIVGNELLSIQRLHSSKFIKIYIALWYKMRASTFLRLGMKKNCLLENFKSLSLDPFNLKVYAYFILLVIPKNLINKIFKKFGS